MDGEKGVGEVRWGQVVGFCLRKIFFQSPVLAYVISKYPGQPAAPLPNVGRTCANYGKVERCWGEVLEDGAALKTVFCREIFSKSSAIIILRTHARQ